MSIPPFYIYMRRAKEEALESFLKKCKFTAISLNFCAFFCTTFTDCGD